MAVLDTLPGVEVTVLVHGEVLSEHRDDEDIEERTNSCYIEAKTDQNFEVRTKITDSFEFIGACVEIQVHVDGTWMSGKLFEASRSDQEVVSCGRCCGKNGRQLQKYRFATMEIDESKDIHTEDVLSVKKLGTIEVVVKHVNKGNRVKAVTQERSSGKDIFSEKALKGKAVSHTTSFDEPVDTGRKRYTVNTLPIPGIPSSAGTFVFKYRSLAALKAMLVIPRSPSPTPLEERDVTTMTADEMRELQRRLRERDIKPNIKRERDVREPRPRKNRRHNLSALSGNDSDDDVVETSSRVREKVVIELD